MKIKILVDNNSSDYYINEHGFSLLINHEGKRILLDTGQTSALFKNATLFEDDLQNLDAVILSHGHYDHGGNLQKILKINPQAVFFAHPGCTIPRFSVRKNESKSIALSFGAKNAIITRSSDKLSWCHNPKEIHNGLWVTGQIPRDSKIAPSDFNLFTDKEGGKVDPVVDDMALWIKSRKGLIIICGCCHAGIVNTINYIKNLSGESEIYALVGGLHLKYAEDKIIDEVISFLEGHNCKMIIPSHCTGDLAVKKLKDKMGTTILDSEVSLEICF